MQQTIILGLSVNTRMLGLAVISKNDLVDYSIQLRKDSWTPRKRELILASLQPWCERYSINSVAMSIPYAKQTSAETKELLEAITAFFKEKKIRLSSYPAKALYDFSEKRRSKKEIMKALALQYPELLHHYHKEMRNKNKYFVKLFEAVGCAVMHSQRINGKRN